MAMNSHAKPDSPEALQDALSSLLEEAVSYFPSNCGDVRVMLVCITPGLKNGGVVIGDASKAEVIETVERLWLKREPN